MNKPEIIVLCGIPCSGKSSWAETHQEIHGHAILSRDDIRSEWWDKYIFSIHNESVVTSIFNGHLANLIVANKDIILDNTHCSEHYLNKEISRKPEGYTLRILFFDCPLWLAHYRNVIRFITTSKWIPIKVINNMKKNYENIDKNKYQRTF